MAASALDSTKKLDTLPTEKKPKVEGEDPAPYTRALNHYQVDPMQNLLKWKLSLYEEPTDPADQAMLLIDQVKGQSGKEESRELGFNLLSQALEKLVQNIATCEIALPKLDTEFRWPAHHINEHQALQALPHKAARTVLEKGADPQAVDDLRPKSDS